MTSGAQVPTAACPAAGGGPESERHDTRVIYPHDPEWPPQLNELGPHAPLDRLFIKGAPLDVASKAVAVVGTRRPTGAGMEAARRFGRGLAEAGLVVVSGLAVGIDAGAHTAALDAGGNTIAVLGCGIDVDYPLANLKLKRRIESHGTVVSEFPARTPPYKANFPLRNRIISGLALGVIVIEGSVKSGALVTARLALDANRSVYAVPGSVRNPMAAGPNELIRTSRAALVTKVEHVFEDLAPGLVWGAQGSATTEKIGCDDTEQAILNTLDDAPLAPDRFAASLELQPGRVAVALSRLEVKGLVARSTGGYFLTGAGARERSTRS